MKWKVFLCLLLVAVAGCQVTMLKPDPQKEAKAEMKKVEAATVERIRQYKIFHEEQQLIRDILLLKVEVAKIQAENAPPQQKPGQIESMEFIPANQIPPDAKVSPGMGAPPK